MKEAFDGLLEKIVNFFTESKYTKEVELAKREFFGPTASSAEDSEQFDVKMAQFLDWYIFDRDLSDLGLTPVEAIKEFGVLELSEEEKSLFESLLKVERSLFEYIKTKGSDIYIKDVIANKKIVVKDSHVTAGFSRDEFFEARVFPKEKSFVFGNGFCFHPSEAKKFILTEVKKVRKLGEPEKVDLMDRLAKMRLKLDQYKHIKCEFIYTNDKKMRI